MSTARVDFTRGAAERIAAVVRQVEQGSRDGAALTFGRALETPPSSKAMRLGKTSAEWLKNSTQDIVIYSGTTLSETATTLTVQGVANKFADIEADKWVMIGRANGAWYLIAAEC